MSLFRSRKTRFVDTDILVIGGGCCGARGRAAVATTTPRHVEGTVHMLEEGALPIMKNPETGHYLREGKWQVMIHGESYKPIIAEAARKSASGGDNPIMVTPLLMDK